ncbi:MAG: ribonuclease J [Geminicoccaceae bacterium]
MAKAKDLQFVALGGVGEIGMNVYAYGLGDEWMLVDLGLGFADDRLPGAEIVLPDVQFAVERRTKLRGLVITHAHEDHIGAVPYLWSRLGCPIWCTAFAAAVLRRKFADADVVPGPVIHVMEPGRRFEVGPFACTFLHVTHSIPDSNGLSIETPYGKVMHTGDWKLDPAPQVGERTDVDGFEAFGDGGVLAMVADSTNVLSPGTSGSEAEVRDSLIDLIARQPGRVALTTFASNLARLVSTMHAAQQAGREIVVIGRSMRRMLEIAQELGLITDMPKLVDERDAAALPRHRVLYLVTGSQGEPRAALVRIALGQHPRVRLEAGDTVIFSSKIIPGNERVLFNLHNLLVDQGVEVITEEDHFVHVSGHPCRDEIEQMYKWMRPKVAIPVHGEARHLHAHVRLAKQLGAPQALLIANGDLVRLAPGPATVVDKVDTGRIAVEETDLVDASDELYKTRRRLMSHGTLLVGLVLDRFGSVLAPPQVSALGAVDLERFEKRRAGIDEAVTEAVEDLEDREARDDDKVREAVRAALRVALDLPRSRRPIVEVQITRLSAETLDALEDDRVDAA